MGLFEPINHYHLRFIFDRDWNDEQKIRHLIMTEPLIDINLIVMIFNNYWLMHKSFQLL